MSSTTPATKLTRRTTLFELVPGMASGRTDLFLPGADTSDPDAAFAQVLWEHVDGREAFADVAVETKPMSRLFAAPTLSAVLLEAFEWAEKEASR